MTEDSSVAWGAGMGSRCDKKEHSGGVSLADGWTVLYLDGGGGCTNVCMC